MDAAGHPVTAMSGEIEEPLYSKATRWRTYLSAHSTAFRSLQEERERGWRSVALDAWYARRQAPAAAAAAAQDSSATATAAPPAPSPAPPPAAGTTSFVAADVVQLAERYRQHARTVTQQAAATFFTRGPSASSNRDGGDTGRSSPLFLDLGCAPGGVSKYLLEDLHWRGVGVSLASTDGGIDVDPALLVSAPLRRDFVLLDGDVTEKAALWCRSSAYAQAATSSDASSNTEAPTVLNGLLKGGTELPIGAFHFVNGGAVLDHGQRQREAQSAGEVVAQDCEANASLPSSSPSLLSPASAGPLLPWFSLLVPQLTHALTYAAEGGAMMLVHGAPHCASFFILLRCMEDVVAAGQSCGAKESGRRHCAARVLETMHLAKPPVYVLWTNLWPGTDGNSSVNGKARGAGDVRAASQAAQQRLLASLSPASPLVSPSADAAADEPLTGAVDNSTRAAKQRFWLGESEDGFQLAVEGFARYGDQVERIWRRVEEFLRRRRERAEREAAAAATTLTRANGSRKRPHSAT